MKDSRFRKVVLGQFRYPRPQGAILLAASPKRSQPEPDDLLPEVAECRKVGWHCVIGEEASDHLRQPTPLFGDGLVPSPSQFLLDLPKLSPQAVPSGLSLEKE